MDIDDTYERCKDRDFFRPKVSRPRLFVTKFFKRFFYYGVGKRPPIYFFDKMHTTIH